MKKLITLSAAGLLAFIGAATHASAQAIDTNFTSAEGWVSTSSVPGESGIDSGTQTSLGGSGQATSPGFYGFHNSDVVNATAGTVTGNGYFLYNGSVAVPASGTTLTESLTFNLGTAIDGNGGIYFDIEDGVGDQQGVGLYDQGGGAFQVFGTGSAGGGAGQEGNGGFQNDTLKFVVTDTNNGTGTDTFTESIEDLTTDSTIFTTTTTGPTFTGSVTGRFDNNDNATDLVISNYSLTESAAVPEPSSVALMLLGLGGVAATLRLRRRTV